MMFDPATVAHLFSHPAWWNAFWTNAFWIAWWGGFGSCLGYLTVFAVAYKKRKCNTCWRWPAEHKVDGTHYRTCHVHFTPEDHEALHEKHRLRFPTQHAFHKARGEGRAE